MRPVFRWVPILLCYTFTVATSQVNDILFERLAVDQDLAHASIYAICQDNTGFIWFGTPVGLIRYDGHTFKTYDRTPMFLFSVIYQDKHGSLWSNGDGQICRLDFASEKTIHYKFGTGHLAWRNFEESGDDLWVGSNGDGLGRYMRSENRFRQYVHDPKDPTSICNDTILTTLVDRQGNLWVGTRRGLDRVVSSSGTFVHCEQLRTSSISAILEDKEQGLWVGTDIGLCRYDESRGVFELYTDKRFQDSNIQPLLQDSQNGFWLATSSGIARFDRSSRRFNLVGAFPHNIRTLANGWLLHPLLEDHQGRIWASIWPGLAVFDRRSDTLELIPSNTGDPRTLPEPTRITALLEDKAGNIWVAMQSGGVCLLDRNRVPFLHIGQNPYDKIQLSQPYVSAILEDSAGILWVGSHYGLDKLNLKAGTRIHFGGRAGGPGMLEGTRIMDIVEDGPEILWLACGAGLYRMNKSTEEFTQFIPHPAPGDPSNDLSSACIDRAGAMWLGGGIANGHLDLFDRAALRVTKHYFLSYDSTRAGMNANPIVLIHEDPSGLLWTIGGALGVFDKSSERAMFYVSYSDSAGCLSGLAHALCEDAAGTLWVGTTAGLDRLDKKTGTFSHFSEQDGLASNNVLGLLEDDSGSSQGHGRAGNLWLLTAKGISRFDPTIAKFSNFGPSDGVPIAASDWAHGCFKNRNGFLYFGGTNGFVRFHPDSVKSNRWVPPIVLSGFKKFYADAKLDSTITMKKRIILSYAENVISFEFAALNYTRPEKNQFAYKLEGFDRDWVNCGTRRTATYTNLEPGSYVFRVKGSNNDGVWNEKGTSVLVVVTPPFWKTWWAYSIYAVLVFGLLYSFRRFERNRIELKHQVDLKDVETKKLHEVDVMKSRFFANISHEFRTPLTLILGPIKELMDASEAEGTRSKLHVVQRNASRLLALVNQLLDLSKLESGNMNLQAAPRDIGSLVRGLSQSFQSYAERKRITFDVTSDKEHIVAYVDKDKFEKILINLLSNAFKFTPDGGTIRVSVAADEAHLTVRVADTGIGIPADKLPRVFDRFYQVDDSPRRAQQGTGIGLSLTRELVELHKGEIEIESQEGRGTTATVHIPLGAKHLRPEEICTPQAGEETDSAVIPPHLTFEGKRAADVSDADAEKLVVLVVEDNVDVRDYIRRNLLGSYRVIEAQDGEEGWNRALHEMPDVIVSDVMMPKMDGFDLCKKLKSDQRTCHIPVILLTARASSRDRIEGLDIGADDYIMKPFEPEEVKARIRNLIAQRKRIHEHFRNHGLLEIEGEKITPVDQKFLQNALAVISKRMSDPAFGVESLAEDMAVSRSLLLKKSEALLGEPPSELIKRTRLNRAAQLIEGKFGNIAEIAMEVGFNNPSYFTESFRKQFGCPPSHYHRDSQSKNA